VVSEASITVRNTATNATYRTASSSAGQYTMPNLPVGPYELTFEVPGFKTLVRRGVEVRATGVLRVDVTLEVGAVTESVRVTAEVPRIQTDSPEVATALSNKDVVNLPLSFSGGRRAENFAYKLAPGATGHAYSSRINGSPAFSKETLIDGASASSWANGDASNDGTLSLEALSEVKLQTSGLSAEFGRFQGGLFNFVMKSGTNEIHGSAYGGIQNEALNANTFANNALGAPRPPNRQRDWGGSFGGPVYLPKLYDGRNRTFFYFAYEKYSHKDHNLGTRITQPLPEFYDGNLSRLLGSPTGQTDAMGRQVFRGAIYDPATFRQLPSGRWVGDMFPGNMIPVARFSQVSQRLNAIAKQCCLPTLRDPSGQLLLLNNSPFPTPTDGKITHSYPGVSIKGDQIISSSHKVSGSYHRVDNQRVNTPNGMWDPTDPWGGPLSNLNRQLSPSRRARLAHDWTVSPRVLNHVTVFYNRYATDRENVGDEAHQVDGAEKLGIQNLSTPNGFPTVNWGGGPIVSLAYPQGIAYSNTWASGWGILETVSFSKGRHFMKAGFETRRNHINERKDIWPTFNFNARATAIPNEAFSGNLTGHSFASYLLGIVDSASYSARTGTGMRVRYYALFFQDDIKVSSKLTLNIGLRWDFQPPMYEVADRLSSWNSNKTDPQSGLKGAYDFAGTCSVCTGKSYFGIRDYGNFGPRLGFAYTLFGKWTLRGSYGILYEGELFNSFGPPFGDASTVQVGGTYPLDADAVTPWRGIFNWDNGFPANTFVPASYDVSWGNRNRPGMFDLNYGRPGYVQLWNLNVQREIARGLVADVGYVGNKGTRLRLGPWPLLNQMPASALSTYGRNLNNAVRNPNDAAANGISYPYPGFQGTVASALRPYPQVQGNNTVNVYGAPMGFSTYHALQIAVNRQFSWGFAAYTSYTWSKTLNNFGTSQVLSGGPGPNPLDIYNMKGEKAVAAQDIPHMLKASLDYELPFGRGKTLLGGAGRIANAIVGGWSVSAILSYWSGAPLGFSGSSPISSWNGGANRANVAAGDLKAAGYSKSAFNYLAPSSPSNTYLNKALFSDPAPLTLGTSARTYAQARGFGNLNEDLGLQKQFRVAETYRFQLRAEFINAFNRTTLGGINTNVTSPLFGQVTSTSLPPGYGTSASRLIQLAGRIDF
jgi:hypothetical protein